jgi:hypothetical protein
MAQRTRLPNWMNLVRGLALFGLPIGLLLLTAKPMARADLGTDFIWVGTEASQTTSVAWRDWGGGGVCQRVGGLLVGCGGWGMGAGGE